MNYISFNFVKSKTTIFTLVLVSFLYSCSVQNSSIGLINKKFTEKRMTKSFPAGPLNYLETVTIFDTKTTIDCINEISIANKL